MNVARSKDGTLSSGRSRPHSLAGRRSMQRAVASPADCGAPDVALAQTRPHVSITPRASIDVSHTAGRDVVDVHPPRGRRRCAAVVPVTIMLPPESDLEPSMEHIRQTSGKRASQDPPRTEASRDLHSPERLLDHGKDDARRRGSPTQTIRTTLGRGWLRRVGTRPVSAERCRRRSRELWLYAVNQPRHPRVNGNPKSGDYPIGRADTVESTWLRLREPLVGLRQFAAADRFAVKQPAGRGASGVGVDTLEPGTGDGVRGTMKVAALGSGYVVPSPPLVLPPAGMTSPASTSIRSRSAASRPDVAPSSSRVSTIWCAKQCRRGGFALCTCLADALPGVDVTLICVGTPSASNGGTELRFIERVSADLRQAMESVTPPDSGHHSVVVRSTVPPGTVAHLTETYFADVPDGWRVGTAMCPEFLRRAAASPTSTSRPWWWWAPPTRTRTRR